MYLPRSSVVFGFKFRAIAALGFKSEGRLVGLSGRACHMVVSENSGVAYFGVLLIRILLFGVLY